MLLIRGILGHQGVITGILVPLLAIHPPPKALSGGIEQTRGSGL